MALRDKLKDRRILLGAGIATFALGAILTVAGLTQVLSGDGGGPEEVVHATATADLTVSPSPTPAPTATPVPGPPQPPLGDQPYRIHIASIGVDAPVAAYGLDENQIPEVPTGAGAAQLVAWYTFSAQPGTGSNAVFAGHVTWSGRGVFYNLKTIAPGDSVELVGDDGTTMVYKVSEVYQVDPDNPESLKVMAGTPDDVITIITCDGAYSDNNDPVFGGEYSHRLVVRAALESVKPAGTG
jgi:LPXTG-site transpeptidase (sortase) family protein